MNETDEKKPSLKDLVARGLANQSPLTEGDRHKRFSFYASRDYSCPKEWSEWEDWREEVLPIPLRRFPSSPRAELKPVQTRCTWCRSPLRYLARQSMRLLFRVYMRL